MERLCLLVVEKIMRKVARGSDLCLRIQERFGDCLAEFLLVFLFILKFVVALGTRPRPSDRADFDFDIIWGSSISNEASMSLIFDFEGFCRCLGFKSGFQIQS